MKTSTVALLIASIATGGCATTEQARQEMLATVTAECRALGAAPGTGAWEWCIRDGIGDREAARKEQHEKVALALIGGLAGAAAYNASRPHYDVPAPPPPWVRMPITCTTSRTGNLGTTTCF